MIFAPTLSYVTANSAIGYSPALISASLLLSIRLLNTYRSEEWLIFLLNISFIFSAFTYLILGESAGLNKLLIASFFVFFFASWISSFSIHNDHSDFLGKLIVFYLCTELIIIAGQIMTIEYGVGFRTSEDYPMMLTGTQFNSNNLAAITVCAFSCYSLTSKSPHYFTKFFVLTCTALLLFFAASRAAIALALLWFFFSSLLSGGLRSHLKILSGLLILAGIGLIFSDQLVGATIFSRISDRLDSFNLIMQDGIGVDRSMDMRLGSYLHFFSNILNLGLGSATFGDYSEFYSQEYSIDNLMAKNPHSLIIELSYWMGFLGLFFFLISSFWIFFLKGRKIIISTSSILIFLIFLVSIHIPSTVAGAPLILLFSFISAEALKGVKQNRPT